MKNQRVAFLAPRTTFSHVAAMEIFPQAMMEPRKDFGEVFDAVFRYGRSGVVPFQNVLMEGLVQRVPRLLVEEAVSVVGAKRVMIRHHLLTPSDTVNEGTPWANITKVYSKAEVFEQCATWLRNNLPDAELVAATSTAAGAERALRGSRAAAIATDLAAQEYGLETIAHDIQGGSNNWTRFLVLAHMAIECSHENARTLIAWKVLNVSGSLHKATGPFAEHGINMVDIQIVNLDGEGPKTFICEVEGHQESPAVASALAEMRAKHCEWIKVLGSYHEL